MDRFLSYLLMTFSVTWQNGQRPVDGILNILMTLSIKTYVSLGEEYASQ